MEFDIFFETFLYVSLQERTRADGSRHPSCNPSYVSKLTLTKFAHVTNKNQQSSYPAVLSFYL